MDIANLLSRFVVRRGPVGQEGYYECRCPAHDDRKASLLVGPGDKGIRVKCQAGCRTEDVLAAVGLTLRDLFWEDERTVGRQSRSAQGPKAPAPRPAPVAKMAPPPPAPQEAETPKRIDRVYAYTDEDGKTLFEVVRYVPKTFRQRVPDPSAPGGYRWSIKGVRQVLYHLPQVVKAVRDGETVYVVEGEKDADNLALLGMVATTCAMGAGKWHTEHSEALRGADVCILPDIDEPGQMHAALVARELQGIASSVRVLDIRRICADLPPKGDISDVIDVLGKGETAKALRALTEETPKEVPEQTEDDYSLAQRLYHRVGSYDVLDGGIVQYGKDSIKRLSTFVALPTKIITRDDGVTLEKHFEIKGWTSSGHPLPTITVKADDFAGMGWVIRSWDFAANVMPGNTVRDQLRFAMVEVGNMSAERQTVYTHTGWRRIDGKWVYLHPGGAIGAEGVSVELETALRRYSFASTLEDDAVTTMAVAHGFRDCMAAHVSVPLLGVAFLAPLREFLAQGGNTPRFAVWIKGQSGVRKSTATSLVLSFFGDYRYSDPLPSSFHDTANSIRRKAFVLKDSLLVVDDYHPETSLQERRKMESLVQSLSRAYGNGDNRGRMTADRKLEEATPPRGLAIMSGEQTPDVGPSGVARYYVINVERGDIDITPQLEVMQDMAQRGYLRKAMREYIAWLGGRADSLIGELPEIYTRLRSRALQDGKGAHGRAAEAVAHVMLGYEMMVRYMVDIGAMSQAQADAECRDAWELIMRNSRAQAEEAKEDNPVTMFVSAVRQLLASKQATVVDISTPGNLSAPPSTIGYCDSQYYYLMPDVVFARVCKLYAEQNVVYPLGKRALYKLLRDDGVLESDAADKSTRTKRIGDSVMRLLWIRRVRMDGVTRVSSAASDAEQMTLEVVEKDRDNPF